MQNSKVIGQQQVSGEEAEEERAAATRKALIISVSNYSTNLQPLSFCKNDGEEMYELLKSLGYQIPDNNKLVGYVKFDTMREAIYDFFDNAKTKADDTLIFYYSGHGIPAPDGDMCFASSEINPDDPYRRGFSSYELTRLMQGSVSLRVVTILDCCYSGAAKISKGHEDDAAKIGTAAIEHKARMLQEQQQQGEGKCLLAASQAAQEAYGLKQQEHSIFTYYLLEGLRGNDKSVDVNGNITPYSLGSYIYRAILNLPAKKRPKQKPITKVEASGDIILASYPNLSRLPSSSSSTSSEFNRSSNTSGAIIGPASTSTTSPSPPPTPSAPPASSYSTEKEEEDEEKRRKREEEEKQHYQHQQPIPPEESDNKQQRQQQPKQQTLFTKPKILIPIIAAIAGIIVTVVVLGSGILMHPSSSSLPPPPLQQQHAPILTPSSPSLPPPLITNQPGIINHPPTANNQSVTTSMNKPIDIVLTANDLDPKDNLTAAIVSKPLQGSIGELNPNTGVITYTPNSGFTGTDAFTFKVNDGKTDSSKVGTIRITVNK
jgi:hypothetical protein